MTRALRRSSTFADALRSSSRDADFSLTPGLQPALLASLLDARQEAGKAPVLLIILPTGRESEVMRNALTCLIPDAEILDFPAWETLPHERLSPSAETVGRRIHALRRLRDWEGSRPLIIAASVRAALQPLAGDLTDLEPIELRMGGRGVDLSELATRLPQLAYARVDMVTRRGEFAVRGGILDVFPPTAEHPVRVDFFGDEVDGIRGFSVADQRSLETPLDSVELPPSRELLLSEPVRQRAAEMLHEFPSLAGMLAKIAEGIPVEGMESLAPALVDNLVPVAHYLPEDCGDRRRLARAGRQPRGRPRRDQPRVPRRRLERRDRRSRRTHRPGRGRLPHGDRAPPCGGRSRVVDAQLLRVRARLSRGQRAR